MTSGDDTLQSWCLYVGVWVEVEVGVDRDARVWSGFQFGPGSDRTEPRVRSSLGSGSALSFGVRFRVRHGLGIL